MTFVLLQTHCASTMKNIIDFGRRLVLRLGRWLIVIATDSDVRKDLSRIYARLDGKMPQLLTSASPLEVTREISSTIAEVTGRKSTVNRIDSVVALYNPVAAALRNLRK